MQMDNERGDSGRFPVCQHHLTRMPSEDSEAGQMPSDDELYYLSELFKVFGDQTRVKILYTLMEGKEMCVQDIADSIGMSQSSVSHQLRVLKQSQLVKFRRDGRTICYSLADHHVFTILNQGLEHIQE